MGSKLLAVLQYTAAGDLPDRMPTRPCRERWHGGPSTVPACVPKLTIARPCRTSRTTTDPRPGQSKVAGWPVSSRSRAKSSRATGRMSKRSLRRSPRMNSLIPAAVAHRRSAPDARSRASRGSLKVAINGRLRGCEFAREFRNADCLSRTRESLQRAQRTDRRSQLPDLCPPAWASSLAWAALHLSAFRRVSSIETMF